MKRIIRMLQTIVLAGTLLPLAACNTETVHHNYVYTGESDTWKAVYNQEATETFTSSKGKRKDYSTSEQTTFELQYKGDPSDLSAIKELIYSYKGTAAESRVSLEGPINAGLLNSKRGGTGAFEWEDSVIQVNVEWDGNSEQFELRVQE